MFEKHIGGIMKHIHIEVFNAVIETHFQFQDQFPDRKSLLFPEIQKSLKCDLKVAEEKIKYLMIFQKI